MEATFFLNQKFPGLEITFDEDLEGMESSVVFNLTNGCLGTIASIISLSLTHANSHLVILIQDFRDILREADNKALVKMSQQNLPMSLELLSTDVQTSQGLEEATDILASLAREMTVETIARLGKEWGVGDHYQQMVTLNRRRWTMIQKMTKKPLETSPSMSMANFLESLRPVSMRDLECAQAIGEQYSSISQSYAPVDVASLPAYLPAQLPPQVDKMQVWEKLKKLKKT